MQKTRKKSRHEPASELNIGDLAGTIANSASIIKDVLSGDVVGLASNSGKLVGDISKNRSEDENMSGQKVTGLHTPYYTRPNPIGTEEPRDESPSFNIADQREMKEAPQPHQFINMNPTHPVEESVFKESLPVGGQHGPDMGYKYPYIRSVVQDDPTMGTQVGQGTLAKPENKIKASRKFKSASTPLFMPQKSLSQIIMSAFEVLPKETFGLLFGSIKDQKIMISSVQPSQETQRGESYVQPQKEAIDRLEDLKERISSTKMIGSYHSHVYLERQEVASTEEGASLSEKDAENLLSSEWRQAAIIVGYFSSQAWGLPIQDSNWKRDGKSITCNKVIQAQGRTGFHIRVSAFVKERNEIFKVPIYLSGEIGKEGTRSTCPICGGEVIEGTCRHCGSRVE